MPVLGLERLGREGRSVKIRQPEAVPVFPAVPAEQRTVGLDPSSKPLAAVHIEAAGAFGCDCKLNSQRDRNCDEHRDHTRRRRRIGLHFIRPLLVAIEGKLLRWRMA